MENKNGGRQVVISFNDMAGQQNRCGANSAHSALHSARIETLRRPTQRDGDG